MNEIRPENDVTKLSVPQVILLCFLITAVSSVATALTVVQLVASTPGETVFQTIEKVTETVIEKPVTVDQTKTVVIKEGDLIAKAVADNRGSGMPLMLGEGADAVVFAYGFVTADNQLVAIPAEKPNTSVFAGEYALGYYGSDKISLWQATNNQVFVGSKTVAWSEGSPQVGQTVVYLGADGSIERGLIHEHSNTNLVTSMDLFGKEIGLILDVGGGVIGLWNGSSVLRSAAVQTQIGQLATNELQQVLPPLFDKDYVPETNPEDVTESEKQSACQLLGGEFNEYDECLGIDNGTCLSLGGEFNECGSACRHDPNAEVCTQQCVQYCQL